MKVLKYAWIGYSSIITGMFSVGMICIIKGGMLDEFQSGIEQTLELMDWK